MAEMKENEKMELSRQFVSTVATIVAKNPMSPWRGVEFVADNTVKRFLDTMIEKKILPEQKTSITDAMIFDTFNISTDEIEKCLGTKINKGTEQLLTAVGKFLLSKQA